jgi:hypothetical protein
MTSRERMAEAMARGEPDRPPLMCQLSLGHYFLRTGLDAIDVWHDTHTFSEALTILRARYDFDGILVNLPGRDPAWREHVRSEETDAEGNRLLRWSDGSVTARSDGSPSRRSTPLRCFMWSRTV